MYMGRSSELYRGIGRSRGRTREVEAVTTTFKCRSAHAEGHEKKKV